MRLPIKVASAIRARKLFAPGARILVALSGGPDSVALLHCLLELSRKRDFRYQLAAAHLNHGLRGKMGGKDQDFCRKLCKRLKVDFVEARCETKKLAADLKRSREEAGRYARRTFLARATAIKACQYLAVAHHADDRIETVLYRLCRGTGLAGLEGIGWTGPLELDAGPDVAERIEWLREGKPAAEPFLAKDLRRRGPEVCVVRPLLGCTRAEITAYLKSKRQRACTDETNFDTRIPRNALRRLVIPVLEERVHPGVRGALWRLAEEAGAHAERRAWRRGWLDAIAALESRGFLALPAPRGGPPPSLEELADVAGLLRALWQVRESPWGARHLQALRALFGPSESKKGIALPGGLRAERRKGEVWIQPGN